MDKNEAMQRLTAIEKEAVELKKMINSPVPVTERIKTFSDACMDIGVDEQAFNNKFCGHDNHIIKHAQMIIIADALNEGWTPDWNNDNEYKWYPCFNMKSEFGFDGTYSVSWNAGSAVCSRLCFKTDKLAKYAGTQFTEIYKGFMVI